VCQCLAPPFHLAESQIRREPERLYKATEKRLSPTWSTCCSFVILPSPPRRHSVADRLTETHLVPGDAMADGDEVEAIAPSHLPPMNFSWRLLPKCCDTHSSTHVTSPSRKSSNIPHLHPTMVLQIFVGTSGHVAAGTHVKPRDGSQDIVGETVSIRRALRSEPSAGSRLRRV
jgi:hypothetical protein